MGQYRDGDKLIDILMRAPRNERDAMSDLQNMQVPTASGRVVPLTQVARIAFRSEPGVIWRENRDFGVTVQSDRGGRHPGPHRDGADQSLFGQARRAAGAGYRITVAGAEEESGKAGASIAAQLPLCIFIIFTLLMLQLHSFSRSLMVFLTGRWG
ncbi:efflux RND transporter permease subunit [Cupriavidus basilensis]